MTNEYGYGPRILAGLRAPASFAATNAEPAADTLAASKETPPLTLAEVNCREIHEPEWKRQNATGAWVDFERPGGACGPCQIAASVAAEFYGRAS